MTGYIRKDTTNNIADGNIINATDLDNEFDGVQAAFVVATGHTHDGTASEGAAITKIGPVQDVVVSIAAMYPKTTNTIDLGTSSLKYKDAFFAGNETVGGTLVVTGVTTLTAQPVLSSLTASQAVFTNGTKGLVSNAITGTGNVVMSTSPTLVTPALGTPASGIVTNLTGTASININGTVGATTPAAGSFTNITGSANAVISTTDNTNAALRITQLGTGNALLVEDEANPDATPFVISSSGSVIQGATTLPTGLVGPAMAMVGSTAFGPQFLLSNKVADTSAAYVLFRKDRAGVIVNSGDSVGNVQFFGFDGTSYIPAASIIAAVDGTPGLNDMPGRLLFSTTADGASTPTERMRISSTGQTTISGNAIISVTDNTNAALRITQLGTGNALLVEDSTNPDGTPVVIDNAGNLTVGAGTQMSGFGLLQALGTGGLLSAIGQFSADTGGAIFSFNKSRSTTIGSPTTIVASGDSIGQMRFYGADGTNFIRAAAISAEVDGTPGTNDMPGRLTFSTTADGASTPTERMRIDSAGNVGIGGAATAGTTFDITKSQTGATAGVTVSARMNPAVDVTVNSTGYQSFAINGVGTSTTNFLHYNAIQGTFSGTAPTNQYGFNVSSSLTGATNNYGFYSNIASTANRWNFYAAGTARNYMAADLTVNGATAIPAGGTAGAGLMVSTTANFGVFFGSGAPTLSAAKGSLYLRSDGTTVNDRMYVNTNGSTTWTNVVTAA